MLFKILQTAQFPTTYFVRYCAQRANLDDEVATEELSE
jgi:hypothetical protein